MTQTSSFGVSRRESHDASPYYKRRLIDLKESKETVDPQYVAESMSDFLACHSAENMHELRDGSVALTVTSPPYHVGKDYDTNSDFDEYLALVSRVMRETLRVTEVGGRCVINVAGLGRRPYVSLPKFVDEIMQEIGWLPRGEILWVKGKGASGSCAWGSWRSASNPVLRDLHEYFLVYCKDRYTRGRKGKSTISAEDFMQSTLSVWEVAPESAKRVGHPAPFPVEIPRRFIQLYTYENDIVLDPFNGAGSTCVAAVQTNRRWAGYDIVPEYHQLAEKRIDAALEAK